MAENVLPVERNQTIDAAKGIGILLVVFAHMNYVEPWQSIIYGFHIPLFFVLAGMTFQQSKYPSFAAFVKRRVQTLIVPYLFFGLLSVLVRLTIDLVFDGISDVAFINAGKYLWQLITARYSQQVLANVALWFVPCLFLLECMYFGIACIPNSVIRICIIVLLVALGWFTESSYCPVDFSVLPWNFSSACFSIGFYAVGHLASSKIFPVVSQNGALCAEKKTVCSLVTAFFCIAVVVVAAKFNGRVSIGSRILGNGLLFYISGIIGSLGILCVGSLLKKCSPITFWGRSSFCIMATHLLIQKIILRSYEQFLHGKSKTTYFSWHKSLMIFAVVMVVSSALAMVYNYIRRETSIKNKHKKATGE